VSFGWLDALEVVGIILVLLAAILVGLAVRRRWVARQGGTFECSLRQPGTAATGSSETSAPSDSADLDRNLDDETPSTAWVLGVARYSGEYLEWFRFFSLAWWPKHRFLRSDVSVVEHRVPSSEEAVALYADQEIVTVSVGAGSQGYRRDLAMSPDSLTGMLSWLEAAPPGIGRY